MKLRQKIYDSSESINRLIKITNSFHHYNNLKKIKERKPLYYINNFKNTRNKNASKSNLAINNNYIYSSKKNDIIINSIDKMKYNGFMDRENKKYITKKGKGKENKKYKNIINTYGNNKNFDNAKHKNISKSKLFLPPIKNHKKYQN